MRADTDLFEQPRESRRVQFKLPWPPSVNAYWRGRAAGKTVIVYKTPEARVYSENVRAIVLAAHGIMQPLDGDLVMDIVLHAPDARRRDADNFNKCVWDALQGAGVFRDDSQVQSYRVTKGAVVRGGLVLVEIWER